MQRLNELKIQLDKIEFKLDTVLAKWRPRGRPKDATDPSDPDFQGNVWAMHVFRFWNQQEGLPHHKILTDKVATRVKVLLRRPYNFKLDEICEAIGNYALVMNSDEYFFPEEGSRKRPWTLEEFLFKGVDIFRDRQVVEAKFRKNKPVEEGT